jgi:hypothetical protein
MTDQITDQAQQAYRELTPEEIIRLGQELEDYRRWEDARDYVAALYGPGAHQITISVMSEYNDSGYDEDVHIVVTDADGNPLLYDFTQPWWTQFTLSDEDIADYLKTTQDESARDDAGSIGAIYSLGGSYSYHGSAAYRAVQALCTEKLGIEFVEHWQPHDPLTFTYVVATPPTISFARVYVPEAAPVATPTP